MTVDVKNFNDVEHLPLRVFNRSVTTFNLLEFGGEAAAREYLEQFSENERKQIFIMNQYIKSEGEAAARKVATKGLEGAAV